MKRLMPSSLIAFLQSNPNCYKADLFVITLPNASTIYTTEGQWDITVPSGTNGWTGSTTTFSANTYGRWNRGAITAEASFDLNANSMSLTCIPQPGTSYPNISVGLLAAAFNGLFDAATLSVYTAYMPLNQPENLCRYSQDFTQAAWGKVNSGSSNPTVVISSSVPAPDMSMTASAISFPIVGASDYSRVQQSIPIVPANSTVTFGVWLQASSPALIRVEIISQASPFNGASQTVNVTTSWQFFSLKQTWSSDTGTDIFVLLESSNSQPSVTVYAWGAQVALGPTLPSYQITTTNASTGQGFGNVSAGLETKFVGFIEKITKINRVMVDFECQDVLYLLNQKIPAHLVQSGCPWSFCDSNCTLLATNYTVTFTAKTGSTSYLLTPTTAFTQAAGYFSQGVVTCTAGANVGLSSTVKLHDSSGNLEITLPFLLPVSVGDTFSVIKGCDKSTAMCSNTILPSGSSVNNLVNFGGAPEVPQPITAV